MPACFWTNVSGPSYIEWSDAFDRAIIAESRKLTGEGIASEPRPCAPDRSAAKDSEALADAPSPVSQNQPEGVRG